MKLVSRLSLVLVGTMSAVLFGRASTRVLGDNALFEERVRRDHAVTAHVLRISVAEVWETQGPERVKHLIDAANRASETLRFRWVPLDSAERALSAPELAVLATGGDVQHIVHDKPSDELVCYFPVASESRQLGILELRESLVERDEHARATWRTTLLSVGAGAGQRRCAPRSCRLPTGNPTQVRTHADPLCS